MRKLFAILLNFILIFSALPATAEVETMLWKNATPVSDVRYVEMNGRQCVLLEKNDILSIRADASIAEKTVNLALRIVYLDKGSNFIWADWRLQGGDTRNRLIHKSNSGEFREAIVYINKGLYNGGGDNGEDIRIFGYETRTGKHPLYIKEYISEIELISLDSIGLNEENGKKKHLLYQSTAQLLQKMDLLPAENLEDKASISDINTYFEKITGLKGTVTEATMQSVLENWTVALGYAASNKVLLRPVEYKPAFYGFSDGRPQQNFGITTVTNNPEQAVFYDDLAGLLYNLLFVSPASGGDIYLVTLAKNDAMFKEKMLDLNDYLLANTYYHYAGIEISERAVTDSLTGETIIQLYMKGGNVNSTYVNEFASVDGENYLLCAAFDKRQGQGVPVIYNRTTKKTVELSRGGGIIQFAMMMSRQNVAYWTEGATLYSYNVLTGEKHAVFTEPDGAKLQDIPTITNDGNYITVFAGKEVFSHPDTIYRVDARTGDYKVLVDAAWVKEHFGNAENPHAGHIIINPEDPELVNFMHGGGTNVTDRLWVYDHGKIYQPYIQTMKTQTPTAIGEHITHAFWSVDGKRLYFLRPPASSTSVENGITYLDMTEESEIRTPHVLNGDYSYIHTAVDEGDKHFISDTQIVYDNGQFRNEIVFYSDVAKKSYLLAYVPVWSSHPCHSHPTFTGDWKKVVFNMIDEVTENCLVAVMDVEKVAQQLDSGEYDVSNRIAWLSGKKSSGLLPILPNYDNIVTVSGQECIKIQDTVANVPDLRPEEEEASLNIEVFGGIVPKNESTVTVSVTYWDAGNNKFSLKYNTNSDEETDAKKNKKAISVSKTNTNTWKTVTFVLEDASFRSANADNTDFMLLPEDLDTLYIKDIAVFSGKETKLSYSAPEKIGNQYYLPIWNPENTAFNIIAVADTGSDYIGDITTVKANGLSLISFTVENYEKLFVWRDTLKPLSQKGILFSPVTLPLAAPTDVRVNAETITNSTVELSWTPPMDDTWIHHYNIYRNGEFVGSTKDAKPSFRDVGISHRTQVIYSVSAVDMLGRESERSIPSQPVVTDDIARLYFGAAASNIGEGTTSSQLSASDYTEVSGYNLAAVGLVTGDVTANSGSNYITALEAVTADYQYDSGKTLGLPAIKFHPNMSRVLASIPEGEFLEAIKQEDQDELKLVMNYFDYQPNKHTYVDSTGKDFSNMIRYAYNGQLNGTTGVNTNNSQRWNTKILIIPTANNKKKDFEADSSNLYTDVFRDRPFQYKAVNSKGTKTAATNGIDTMFGIGNSSGSNPVYLSKLEIGMKDYVPYGAVVDFDKPEETQFVRLLRRSGINEGQLITIAGKTAIELDSAHAYNRLLKLGFCDSYLTKNDRDVIIRITYLDNHIDETDSQGLTVAYDTASGKKASKIIRRNGTNTWKTAVFMIDNAALGSDDGALQLGTIQNHDYDWYISRVEVIKR